MQNRPLQVNPDTVFQLASVSKPIASTVVASLVGRREVSWDDRIIDLDPGFRLSDLNVTEQLTIRDLLLIAAACRHRPAMHWRI
jgi:CubicO group peptidase (beta-lactamase class C family)